MARVMACIAMVAALAAAGAANAADKVVLQLHGSPTFEFAGYYAALWQGFYRDAGLDVTIKPSTPAGKDAPDPVRAVTEGRAQFGTGTADLVVRAAQGLPIVLLAPIFQRSGAEIYYRAGDDYASPGALAGSRIGRLPASNILDIELATALKAEGIDPNKVTSVPIKPGQGLTMLADRTVDAIPGSAWLTPWLAHQQHIAVKNINPADYRVEFYGDTLFTLRRLVTAKPAMVRAFRAASLKGWDYALQHSAALASRMLRELPQPPGITDLAGFFHYQTELARRLARYPSVPLGHSNPARWHQIETALVGVGALLRTPDSDDFVYDPDAAARRRHDGRTLGIVAVTLVVIVLGTVWFWRRSRPLAVAPVAPAATRESPNAEPPPAAPPLAAAAPAPPLAESPAAADLNAVLGRFERVMRRRVARGAGFRLSLAPEPWRCRAEPRALRALVLELVTAGADDLRGPGGEVIVGTRNIAFDEAALAATPGAQLGEYVRVTVRDNGAGLTEAALDRVFDPLTSVRPAVAAAVAPLRTIGGFARVESAEGVGTAVHLYFPRVVPAAAAPTANRQPGRST